MWRIIKQKLISVTFEMPARINGDKVPMVYMLILLIIPHIFAIQDFCDISKVDRPTFRCTIQTHINYFTIVCKGKALFNEHYRPNYHVILHSRFAYPRIDSLFSILLNWRNSEQLAISCKLYLEESPGYGCFFINQCLYIVAKVAQVENIITLQIADQEKLEIVEDTFPILANINQLIVNHNKNVTLEGKVFKSLKALHSLTMVNNIIQSLPTSLFDSLNELTNLDLTGNKLHEIPHNLFLNLSQLVHLNLSQNYITQIETNMFTSNTLLKTLNLSVNSIENLTDDVFKNNLELRTIDLSGNRISSLPTTIFRGLKNLEKVILSNCSLEILGENLFDNNTNLNYIDISHNQIRTFSSELSNLKHLWYLHASNNRLSSLSFVKDLITEYIISLDVSGNLIETLEDGSQFQKILRFEMLNLSNNKIRNVEMLQDYYQYILNIDLSNNEISKINIDWFSLSTLNIINFDYNNLTKLDLPPCNIKLPYRKLSFRHNYITTVSIETDLNIEKHEDCLINGSPKVTVFLEDNPFICNCFLYNFYQHLTSSQNLYFFEKNSTLTCSEPQILSGSLLQSLPKQAFICEIPSNCPLFCSCYRRDYDQQIVLNCSKSGLQTLPTVIPYNTSILLLQNNNLTELSFLKHNYLNQITELYLDKNNLQSIEGILPDSLYFLSLTNNKFKDLSLELRNFASSHDNFRMKISNNSWYCNCESRSLKRWLKRNYKIVLDVDNVTCTVKEAGCVQKLSLYKLPDNCLCPPEAKNNNNVLIVSTILFIIVILLTFTVLFCRNKQMILSYFFGTSFYRRFFAGESIDADKEFDRFIANSSFDRDRDCDRDRVLDRDSGPYE